eukprot:TRINITY_DN4506_c1_g3_i2.p1 TRINITY_DN4506_c1_g3~~TRINITY_DN4506_c1_g3_i2.p1  ORF type:complete len:201 (-),score=15.93 TRINITY_DN4506_c1_g3_i2:189-791(-)
MGRYTVVEEVTEIPILKEFSKSKTKRFHFKVDEHLLRKFVNGKKTRSQNFYEFVHDTKDLALLKQNYWLICRITDDDVYHWKLRKVNFRKGTLEWEEWTDFEVISAMVRERIGCKRESPDESPYESPDESPDEYCPCIYGSMNTTRLTVESTPNVWIDFSSWDNKGHRGMYVVGSCMLNSSEAWPSNFFEDKIETGSVAG